MGILDLEISMGNLLDKIGIHKSFPNHSGGKRVPFVLGYLFFKS